MTEPRYPGYDVLGKWDTLSWNDRTREVIARRLGTPREPRFFTALEWEVADALCRRIMPGGDALPLVALLDAKLLGDEGDGFREASMPYMAEAWRLGLAGFDAEATARHGRGFAALGASEQDALLRAAQRGAFNGARWSGLDPRTFFERRVLTDVPALYYSLPEAWSEIGFGGPASPRGYVRLDGDRLDPWEAREARSGDG